MEKHRAHVCFQIHPRYIERKRPNTRCRCRPNTGKCQQRVKLAGNGSIVVRSAFIGAALQRQRTAVISHALPFIHYIGR